MVTDCMFLGVDPGKSGGIAWISDGKAFVQPMPPTEGDTVAVFRQFSGSSVIAVIENVHAMPTDSRSGAFKFGTSYGFLRSCLHWLSCSFTSVSPHSWQVKAGVAKRKGADAAKVRRNHKNALKAKAQEIFPRVYALDGSPSRITLKTADALLLAWIASGCNAR